MSCPIYPSAGNQSWLHNSIFLFGFKKLKIVKKYLKNFISLVFEGFRPAVSVNSKIAAIYIKRSEYLFHLDKQVGEKRYIGVGAGLILHAPQLSGFSVVLHTKQLYITADRLFFLLLIEDQIEVDSSLGISFSIEPLSEYSAKKFFQENARIPTPNTLAVWPDGLEKSSSKPS